MRPDWFDHHRGLSFEEQIKAEKRFIGGHVVGEWIANAAIVCAVTWGFGALTPVVAAAAAGGGLLLALGHWLLPSTIMIGDKNSHPGLLSGLWRGAKNATLNPVSHVLSWRRARRIQAMIARGIPPLM